MIDRSPLELAEQLLRIHRNEAILEYYERERRWRNLADSLAEIHDASRQAEWMVQDILNKKEAA